ncbi:MAG: manganese efflux pump MntP family protein, partial [Dokdonella sp.]
MHPISIFLIALAMSTDAFAAAVAKGAAMQKPSLFEALRAGVIFGTIEGLTPIIGWLLGMTAAKYISAIDHWVAFVLLCVLGLCMIYAGSTTDPDTGSNAPRKHGLWSLAATGFATSIDAMVVGVGLAFVDVSITTVALAIGATTFVMVTAGILLGRVIGALVGKRAEVLGGIVLIGIGSAILYQHLSAT